MIGNLAAILSLQQLDNEVFEKKQRNTRFAFCVSLVQKNTTMSLETYIPRSLYVIMQGSLKKERLSTRLELIARATCVGSADDY